MRPSFSRAARIDLTAPSPTFLIAASPKAYALSRNGEPKFAELMSGGRTGTPISLHSPRYSDNFSVLRRSIVSNAAMKYQL